MSWRYFAQKGKPTNCDQAVMDLLLSGAHSSCCCQSFALCFLWPYCLFIQVLTSHLLHQKCWKMRRTSLLFGHMGFSIFSPQRLLEAPFTNFWVCPSYIIFSPWGGHATHHYCHTPKQSKAWVSGFNPLNPVFPGGHCCLPLLLGWIDVVLHFLQLRPDPKFGWKQETMTSVLSFRFVMG